MNAFETSETAVAPQETPNSLAQELYRPSEETLKSDFANSTKGTDKGLPVIDLVDSSAQQDSTNLVGDKVKWGKTSSTEAVNRCADHVRWWINTSGQPIGATSQCNDALNNSKDVNDAAYLWNISHGQTIYNSINGSYKFKAGMSGGRAFMFKANPN